jgi:hypothetical protein
MYKSISLSISFILILLLSESFAQSKKELKAQLDELTFKSSREKERSDSLIKLKDKQILELQNQLKSLSDTLMIKNKKIEQKQQELDSYMNATSRMGGRVRMKEPDLSKFDSPTPVTISLKLLVDENGSVIEAINDSKRTSTTDKLLVDQVINAVKKDLRYSREKGASLLQSNYTVKIGPW